MKPDRINSFLANSRFRYEELDLVNIFAFYVSVLFNF